MLPIPREGSFLMEHRENSAEEAMAEAFSISPLFELGGNRANSPDPHDDSFRDFPWWEAAAIGLGPLLCDDPAEDRDVIGRYFDGTGRGIQHLYDMMVGTRITKRSSGLDPLSPTTPQRSDLTEELLFKVLRGRFGLLQHFASCQDALDDAGGYFRGICDSVLKEDYTTMLVSLRKMLSCLRIGLLAQAPGCPAKQWEVFAFRYDREKFEGRSQLKRRKFHSPQASFRAGGVGGANCAVAEQQPMRGAEVTKMLFEDPFQEEDRDKVYWVHAHRQSAECLLAIGQQLELRVHHQVLMSRLESAQPQVDIGPNFEPSWSSIVIPGVYLDEHARHSLDAYRAWYKNARQQANNLGADLNMKQLDSSLPLIKVRVIRMNVMALWTTKQVNAVVSCAARPHYVGRWCVGDRELGHTWWQRACSTVKCCGSRRGASAPEGYQEVKQEETFSDLEALTEEAEDDLHHLLLEEEHASEAEHQSSFDRTFNQVMRQLLEDNSVLRMGNHHQLVFRILLNRSVDYLDVIELYSAALSRLQLLLDRNPGQAYGNELIMKVSAAKTEIEALLGAIGPFHDNVLPKLATFSLSADHMDDLSVRMVRHYRFDMQNNIQQFMRDAQRELKLCERLASEYDRKAQDRANTILNLLTIITFIVMPMQILTGMYGMNFKHMPELKMESGYEYFFYAASGGTLLFSVVLYCLYQFL